MISLEDYLKNPCGTLSIPYWKAKNVTVPNSMKIVHDSEFSAEYLTEYNDERYFRLYSDFNCVNEIDLNHFNVITATKKDFKTIVSVINQSYTDLQVDLKQIKGYTQTKVYDKNLWILVKEKVTDLCVGCGIADFDSQAKEMILEWIQVLPDYRNKKIGQAIVNELLKRAQSYADFATVSGKIDNPTKPEALYRKCGFVGNDIWHILNKK